MDKKGVAIPLGHAGYTSAEETDEVAVEDGYGTLLVPVNTKHNASSCPPPSFYYFPRSPLSRYSSLEAQTNTPRTRAPVSQAS